VVLVGLGCLLREDIHSGVVEDETGFVADLARLFLSRADGLIFTSWDASLALSSDCQLSKLGLLDRLIGFLLVLDNRGFVAALRGGGVVDLEGVVDTAGSFLLFLLSRISMEDMAGLG
jgi:hypothetical protein